MSLVEFDVSKQDEGLACGKLATSKAPRGTYDRANLFDKPFVFSGLNLLHNSVCKTLETLMVGGFLAAERQFFHRVFDSIC